MRKRSLNKLIRDEKGQALMIVLIFMLLSGLIVAPMLGFMSTGIKVGKEVYESKMYEFYAADGGVEDALWYLQSDDRLGAKFDPVDYAGDPDWTVDDISWPIEYPGPTDPPFRINDKDVTVTIDRIWVLKDLSGLPDVMPDEGDADNGNDHWTVVGALNIDVDPMTNYIVDITTDESGDVYVDHMGVWLPQGYSYVDNSVKINGVAIGEDLLVTNPDDQISFRGGTALIWDYSGTTFKDLSDIVPPPPEGHPPAEKFPPSVRFSFDYTITPFKEAKGFFPWMKLVDGRIAWDTEAGIYHIQSIGETPDADPPSYTTVESYVPRGLRRYTSGLGGTTSAIKGDHIVIGNSLMTCCWNEDRTGPPEEGEPCCSGSCNATCCSSNPYRNYAPVPVSFPIEVYPDAERESSAEVLVGAVPGDATIERAYLYWTAWLRGDWLWGEHDEEIEDELGGDWVGWQWDDCRDTDSNPNKWESCELPEVKEWLFNNAYDGTAYLAVNGQKVTPENAGDPAGTVVAGTHYISEGSSDVQPSYQYACFADVTDQVTEITEDVPGVVFTVAGVHAHPAESCASSTWNRSANAGWSMIIIYSSAEKETHQIYLYAGCNHIWGNPSPAVEFTIAGFETPLDLEPGETNEAKITVFASEGDEFGGNNEYLQFKGQNTGYYYLYDVSDTTLVFNSRSSTSGFEPSEIKGQPAGTISGVDIDTYTRTQPFGGMLLSDIVWEGDTSANIKVRSHGDGFMLIFVVFSVRSTKVPAGEEFQVGTMTYEIK